MRGVHSMLLVILSWYFWYP